MMSLLSLLQHGLWQTYACVNDYYAYARSAEFIHSELMEGFEWARAPRDIVLTVGVLAFVKFFFRFLRQRVYQRLSANRCFVR